MARWIIANGSPTTSRSASSTSFPRSVKLKQGETVVFAWITYKSRAQRDKINAKVMKDPRLKEMTEGKPPFDSKRIIIRWLRKPGESIGSVASLGRGAAKAGAKPGRSFPCDITVKQAL